MRCSSCTECANELVALRNGQINQARILLAEFGVVIAVGR